MRNLLLCIGVIACSAAPPPDIQPLVSDLAVAVFAGQTGSLALQAMSGATTCATVKTACAGFPCQGAVTITYGGACQLPLGADVAGTVDVAGTWTSADVATLTSTVVDVTPAPVVKAANLAVTRMPLGFEVDYAGRDITLRDGAVGPSAQSTWRVSRDAMPADPLSDNYYINGSAQNDVITGDVPVLARCHLNPTGGMSTFWKITATNIVATQVRFHQECDGQAEVDGQRAPLDFLR
jgi:hypothetical protein